MRGSVECVELLGEDRRCTAGSPCNESVFVDRWRRGGCRACLCGGGGGLLLRLGRRGVGTPAQMQ